MGKARHGCCLAKALLAGKPAPAMASVVHGAHEFKVPALDYKLNLLAFSACRMSADHVSHVCSAEPTIQVLTLIHEKNSLQELRRCGYAASGRTCFRFMALRRS